MKKGKDGYLSSANGGAGGIEMNAVGFTECFFVIRGNSLDCTLSPLKQMGYHSSGFKAGRFLRQVFRYNGTVRFSKSAV